MPFDTDIETSQKRDQFTKAIYDYLKMSTSKESGEYYKSFAKLIGAIKVFTEGKNRFMIYDIDFLETIFADEPEMLKQMETYRNIFENVIIATIPCLKPQDILLLSGDEPDFNQQFVAYISNIFMEYGMDILALGFTTIQNILKDPKIYKKVTGMIYDCELLTNSYEKYLEIYNDKTQNKPTAKDFTHIR